MVTGFVIGFLLKADHPLLVVDLDDPELVRRRDRHRQAGHGGDRAALEVVVGHLPHVHLVDMVGAEDQDRVGAVLLDEVDVLEDRVGGAAVPALPHAHLRRHDGYERIEAAAVAPGALDVLRQRLRLVLGQHVDRPDARVRHVRQDEIDDAVATSEGHRRLGAIEREREEPRAFAPGHDENDESTLSVHLEGRRVYMARRALEQV